MNKPITSIQLVEGGNQIRQGDRFTLGVTPLDASGQVVDLSGKTINVTISSEREVLFETTASFENSRIKIYVDKNFGYGQMWLEITVTDPADETYRRKFPANRNDGRLEITKGDDDLPTGGVPRVSLQQFRVEWEEAMSGLTEDSEVINARNGESLLGNRLNKDKAELSAQLAEKVGGDVKLKPEDLNTDTLALIEGKASNEFVDELTKKLEAIPITEKTIDTTDGRTWSTSSTEMTVELEGDTFAYKTIPRSVQRKLVVFGSSTAEGFYATPGNSWFDKLKISLEPQGWSVLKRAISGDNTTKAIARFYKDVAVFKPDICVIAFTLGNEGMTAEQTQVQKDSIYSQFKNNILTLAMMCRQHGILPIIVDQSPTKLYDAVMYRMAAELNREIDGMGLYTINFKGALDALLSTGRPINAAMYDNLHPNDLGHNAMYRSIPISLFKHLAAGASYSSPQIEKGALRFPAASVIVDTTTPISFKPAETIESFTLFLRLKSTATRTNQRTWLGMLNNNLRVSNQGTNAFLDMRYGEHTDVVISTVNINDLQEHSMAVTYNAISNFLKFYVDGRFVGEVANISVVMEEVYLGGRPGGVLAENAEFRDFVVYRSRLSDDQIFDLHKGRIYKGGLELHAPLNDASGLGARLSNLAPTDSFAKINTAHLSRV